MLEYLFATHAAGVGSCCVLVSAYACEPGKGSEPGVGWNMVKAIGVDNNAWVVTRGNNQGAIEQELRVVPNENLNFIYVDLPRYLGFWKKGKRGIRIYYYLWQFAALIKVLRLRKYITWDVGHHVTFVNDWLFTFLAVLPIPFVWGPVGSHPAIPGQLALDYRQKMTDLARCFFQSIMRHIDPLFWVSIVRARLIIGISDEVFMRSPFRWVSQSRRSVHTAIGVEDDILSEPAGEDLSGKVGGKAQLDIVSIGRLIPIKGFHLAMEAFALFLKNGGDGRLEIIGRGPLKRRLICLAKELGIQERFVITGWMDRSQVIKRLRSADMFLYPSFESGGIVLLEAIATGTRVMALDYGGPGVILRSNMNSLTPVGKRCKVTKSLANAIWELYRDKEAGAANLNYVNPDISCLLWSRRNLKIAEWYSRAGVCVQQSQTK